MKNKKLLGNSILLLAALIWGTAFVFQRLGMDKIQPISFNAARMTLGAMALGPVVFLLRGREEAEGAGRYPAEQKAYRKNTLLGGICCGFFLSLASIFQQMGLVHTAAGKAGFISAMYMLLVPVIGFLLFRRRNSWLVWLAVLIGMAGMFLLCISDAFTLEQGDLLVLVCALFYSFQILCCDYFVHRGSPVRICFIQFISAALISWIGAVIAEEPSIEKMISAWLPIAYCGLISGGIGYTLQMVGQRITDPATASLLMSMESVFAVLAGVVFLQERLTARELAGCVIMLAAIILVQIPISGRERP